MPSIQGKLQLPCRLQNFWHWLEASIWFSVVSHGFKDISVLKSTFQYSLLANMKWIRNSVTASNGYAVNTTEVMSTSGYLDDKHVCNLVAWKKH